MVLLRTWPIWSTPVTFGGGMTMEYAGLRDLGSATKHFSFSQNSYHLASTFCGSYALGISDMVNETAAAYFFISANSRLSASAWRLASMMLSWTPTVPHSALPSVDSMRTRVRAPVPVAESRMRTL